jgi:hypothetical protein
MARMELIFAFMAVSVLQVRLGASKKGAAPITHRPVLRRRSPVQIFLASPMR